MMKPDERDALKDHINKTINGVADSDDDKKMILIAASSLGNGADIIATDKDDSNDSLYPCLRALVRHFLRNYQEDYDIEGAKGRIDIDIGQIVNDWEYDNT